MTHRPLDEPQWMPEVFRCHGCAALEHKQAEIPTGERGVRVALIRYRRPEEDEDE